MPQSSGSACKLQTPQIIITARPPLNKVFFLFRTYPQITRIDDENDEEDDDGPMNRRKDGRTD